MSIEEQIKNYNPWSCPNCNKKYKNPEKEMEKIVGIGVDNRLITKGDGIFQEEWRCLKCEAHFLIECNIKLNWNKIETRLG